MIFMVLKDYIWCYGIVTMGALISLVGALAACICSCRQTENKSEFSGLPGMVKINSADSENLNNVCTNDNSKPLIQDNCDNGISKANRSLPDIPKDKGDTHRNIESDATDIYAVPIIDGNQSELYATVQDQIEPNFQRDESKCLQSNPTLRFTTITSNNDEHPYAQLQEITKIENNQINRNGNNQTIEVNQPSTSVHQSGSNPIAPPRARRSSSHNSLFHADFTTDIQAANAISGGVQASQDLPYMTPPLLITLPHLPESTHNNHFSGDSQDSKGYTSISVREPLANIMGQSTTTFRPHPPTRTITDPHYATVSDDSDEMYAAIDEQDKIYTSGSETYAQIQPTSNNVHRERETVHKVFSAPLPRSEESNNAPQPPSVDSLRHVAHVHSRQASSSSATSSIVNPSSPKPEKRQANSPLPPPPEVLAQLYAVVDKKNKTPKISSLAGKSLDEMYSKVIKKKKDNEEQIEEHAIATPSYLETSNPLRLVETSFFAQDSSDIPRKEIESSNNVQTEMELRNNSHGESPRTNVETNASCLETYAYDCYETYDNQNSHENLANARISNYEILRPQSGKFSEFQNCLSLLNQESNRNPPVPLVPPFKHRNISNASSEDPGYETVRLQRRIDLDVDEDSEPNYESMPHDTGEPNYASVSRPSDSDTDPNYESVTNNEYPNYESVTYMTGALINEEPPYEQVNNYKSDVSMDGYEQVQKNKIADSDYEKIATNPNCDTDDELYIQV